MKRNVLHEIMSLAWHRIINSKHYERSLERHKRI